MALDLNVWTPEEIARHYADGWWDATTLSEMSRRNAEAHPEKVAYYDDGGETTFASLEDGTVKIAAALHALGFERGDTIAVMLPDSAVLHAVWVAAERAGLVIVTVPNKAGLKDIIRLSTDAGCKAIVTSPQQRDETSSADMVAQLRQESAWSGRHMTVDQDGADWTVIVDGALSAATLVPPEERALTADELFMIVYTSGTTGRPKGVMQTMNRWKWMHKRCTHLRSDDVFLVGVPATGGFGLWFSHFSPPLLGASTVLRENFSTAQVLADIETYKVTVLVVVPTQLKMLLADPNFNSADLSSLRILEIGGEPLPYRQALEFEQKTGAVCTQFYGSTESLSVAGPTKAEHPEHLRLGTTGQVIPESELRLLDETGRPVAMPGRGRCASRGPGRTPGYFNDPAANDALFWEDGFVLLGDIIEVDDEGFVRVVGRVSDFILRGGLNISAPEVEEAVLLHPRITNAAAVPMPDPLMGERVCVYVTTADGEPIELEEVTKVLAEHNYTKYKWPEQLITLPELPTAPGGKVAKAKLKADILVRLESEAKSQQTEGSLP